MNYTWEISKIIIYLILVLGLVYLLSNFMRRKFQPQTNSRYIKIIEKIYLSPKAVLMLVKVNEKIILLSISDNKINNIESWDSEEFKEIEAENKDFKSYFHGFLTRKSGIVNRRDNDEK